MNEEAIQDIGRTKGCPFAQWVLTYNITPWTPREKEDAKQAMLSALNKWQQEHPERLWVAHWTLYKNQRPGKVTWSGSRPGWRGMFVEETLEALLRGIVQEIGGA